jgi:hypothetical protein
LSVVLTFSMLITAHPARAAVGEDAVQSPFAGVASLQQKVTCVEPRIALHDLLSRVTRSTGVRVFAMVDVGDEPLSVAVRDVPAGELLEQVAELLGYGWRRVALAPAAASPDAGPPTGRASGSGFGFELRAAPAAREREAALRRQALAAMERRLEVEVRRLAEMALAPPEPLVAVPR